MVWYSSVESSSRGRGGFRRVYNKLRVAMKHKKMEFTLFKIKYRDESISFWIKLMHVSVYIKHYLYQQTLFISTSLRTPIIRLSDINHTDMLNYHWKWIKNIIENNKMKNVQGIGPNNDLLLQYIFI